MKEQQKISQSELDSLILQKEKREPTVTKELPKGLTKQTLQLIWQKIESLNGRVFTTDEMAQLVGISRVSIRKYVMFLTDIGVLENEMMYQHVGRPVSKLRCVDQKKIEFTYKRLNISRLYFLITKSITKLTKTILLLKAF